MIYKKSIYKRIIAVLMALTIFTFALVSRPVEVKATGVEIAGLILGALTFASGLTIAAENDEDYSNWYYENVYSKPANPIMKALAEIFSLKGLLFNPSTLDPFIHMTQGDVIQNVKGWLKDHTGQEESEITDDQAKQAVYNMFKDCNVNSNNDTYTLSNDLYSYALYVADQIKASNKYYQAYTLDLRRYAYSNLYTEEVKNLITKYQDNYWIIIGSNGGAQSTFYYHFIEKSKVGLVYNSETGNDIISGSFWNNTTFTDKLTEEGDSFYYYKSWNGDLSVKMPYSPPYRLNFSPPSSGASSNMYARAVKINKEYISSEVGIGPAGSLNTIVSYGKRFPITMYSSLGLMSSVLRNEAPYYEGSNWKEFVNNGNLTIDKSNTTNITYGDVVTYNNNYQEEHGEPPTMQDIIVYIDVNVPENNQGGSGSGGSGGSGGAGGAGGAGGNASASAHAQNGNVSANIINNNNPTIHIDFGLGGSDQDGNSSVSGNAVSGGIGNIFGFLSGIGEALKSLIVNLGTALGSLISGIAEIIDDIVVGIPNIFSSLLNLVFGGLPDELKSVVLLGLTCMVIFGVVKFLRG